MKASQRVVTHIPVTELWNDDGTVDAVRIGFVGEAEILRLLKEAGFRFVVANVGTPLRWLPAHERFGFWKTDVQVHLVAPDAVARGFRLEDFPNAYCYLASEWRLMAGAPAVLLEMHH